MFAVTLCIFGVVPLPLPATQTIARMEQSYVYDGDGTLMLQQMIFYEATPTGYEVIAWRLWKDSDPQPTYNFHAGLWELWWSDGETMRHIYAYSYEPRWDQFDPELERRRIKSQHLRPNLERHYVSSTVPEMRENPH